MRLRSKVCGGVIAGLLLPCAAGALAQTSVTMPVAPPPPVWQRMSRAEAPSPQDADRVNGNYVDVSRKEAEQMMAAFLRCEVKSEKGRAAALAYTREVAETPSTYPQRLIKSSCALRGSRMAMNPELVRLSLFPALYERDFAKGAPTIAPIAQADLAKEFDGTPGEGTLVLRRFGGCVVTRDAASSRTLVLSKLYSDAEQQALAALQPALGNCVQAGAQLHFTRSVLRGAVAEALYKMSAPPAPAKVN